MRCQGDPNEMTLLGQASGPYEMDTAYTLHTHTESPSSPDSVLRWAHELFEVV